MCLPHLLTIITFFLWVFYLYKKLVLTLSGGGINWSLRYRNKGFHYGFVGESGGRCYSQNLSKTYPHLKVFITFPNLIRICQKVSWLNSPWQYSYEGSHYEKPIRFNGPKPHFKCIGCKHQKNHIPILHPHNKWEFKRGGGDLYSQGTFRSWSDCLVRECQEGISEKTNFNESVDDGGLWS